MCGGLYEAESKGESGKAKVSVVKGEFEPAVGLCSVCLNVRRLKNGRGSTFYFCELALLDRQFRKYPQLPIAECVGFEPAAFATDS